MSHSSGGVLSKKKQIPVCSNIIGDRRWSAGARNGDKGIKFNYIVIYWDVIIMVLRTGIIQIPWMLPVFRLPWMLLAAKVYSCFKNWGNCQILKYDTAFAMQMARPSCGLDEHKFGNYGGPISSTLSVLKC